MKRRTGEMCSKWPRRTVNRSRGKLGSVAENVWWCSPGFVYIRVLSFWAFVLVVDFLLEFRLELLWPLWLLLTSVYDSFKYQGLAFSVFFVCLSLTADFLCFLFIPVQWLFFVAPTYVWIQYVWHTERGICLPTICLWVLFIYVEASIRLKDLKHFPGHLDLCRPFAAHCIGYPVVTWGFDIKGYVSYRIRQRKQREVAKENEFYYELLVQSLPAEQQEAYHLRNSSGQQALSSTVEDLASVPLANGSSSVPSSATCNSNSSAASAASKHVSSFSSSSNTSSSSIKKDKEKNAEKNYEKKGSFQDFHEAIDAASLIKEKEKERGEKEKDKDKERDKEKEREKEKEKRNKLNNSTQIVSSNNTNNAHIKQRNNIHSNSSNEANTTPPPSEHVLRLEADIKRLKADLQASRQSEAELRSQLAQLTSNERSVRAELSQSQQDNDSLQAKLHGLVSARQSDKQTMASLEKRLQEERKCRMLLETQLANERRNRANDVIEATKAQQRSKSTNGVGECGENCRQRRRELEMEVQQLRRDNKSAEDRLRSMEMEIQHLRRSQQTTTPPQQQQQQHQQQQHQQQQHQQQQLQQQQHQQQQLQQQQHQQQQLQQQQHQQQQHQHQQHNVETELLVSALAALQDKTSHLESSLSAETRLKLDLFSALGEAKRQLEHRENLLLSREREISELKAKVTEVLAVMPTLNDSSQLGHNMGISDLNNHGLGSMGSLSSYLSTYPLSMTDLGLSSNLNLGDLNLDHGSTSPITLTPSSPLTPMRPYTSKLFNHANGGSMGVNMSGGGGIDTDKGSKPGSNLDPNATAYTPKAMGNGEL